MADMYSIIMDLPLFKGISREQVSSFLEKTSIEFRNFNPSEIIIEQGNIIDNICFIISGEVTISWLNPTAGITLKYAIGKGSVLGANYLFGMHRNIPFGATAKTKVSALILTKSQYLALLESSQVYMLNYLNYLSLQIQRPQTAIVRSIPDSLHSLITDYLLTLTPRNAHDIAIAFNRDKMTLAAPNFIKSFKQRASELESQGLIKWSAYEIKIISRNDFINGA